MLEGGSVGRVMTQVVGRHNLCPIPQTTKDPCTGFCFQTEAQKTPCAILSADVDRVFSANARRVTLAEMHIG